MAARRCSPPHAPAWWYLGSEQSTAFGQAATRARSERVSPSSVWDGGQQVNQGLIGLPGLYCKTRDAAPQIGAVEGRALVDFPGEVEKGLGSDLNNQHLI